MFVRANHFNYDTLLNGIVEHLDLQDEAIDDQTVLNVFKGFEKEYKELKHEQKLSDWEVMVASEFISAIQIGSLQYKKTMKSMNEQPDDRYDFHTLLVTILEELPGICTGEDDGDLWCEVELFFDKITNDQIPGLTLLNDGTYIIENGARLTPDQFGNFLKDWVERHLSMEMKGLHSFLFDNINENILPREYMKDLTICDIPGSKVEYGNALITFPLILLEVYER